jgi:hypothetical protein
MAKMGYDNENIGRTNRFKGIQGEIYRMAMLDKVAEHVIVHYLDKSQFKDAGYYICTKDKSGQCRFCECGDKRASSRQDRFGAHVLRYRTDWKGNPVTPIEWRIEWWPFGPDKYVDIRKIADQVKDVRQTDIRIECVDANFQKFKIDAVPGGALWLKDKNEVEKVKKAYIEKTRNFDGERELARELTIPEQEIVVSGRSLRDIRGSAQITNNFGAQGGSPVDQQFPMTAGSADLDALLSGATAPSQPPPASPSASVQPAAPDPTAGTPASQNPPTVLPASPTVPPSSAPAAGPPDDMDALLAELEGKK